jgi:hypothetical protein
VPEDTTAISAKKEAVVVSQYAGWNPILDGLAGYGVQPPAARHAAALASDEPEVFDHEPELVFEREVRHHKEAHASVTYGLAFSRKSPSLVRSTRPSCSAFAVSVLSETSVPSLA